MKFFGFILFIFLLCPALAQEQGYTTRDPRFKLWFNTYLRQLKGEVSESYNYPSARIFTSIKEAAQKPDSVYILKLCKQGLRVLPPEIIKFKNLQYIDLSDNKITEIPAVIGEIKSLRFFYIDNNKLQKISNSINKCHNLAELSLAGNQMKSLSLYNSELKNLRYLDIRGNVFRGIESFIKIYPSLFYLDTRDNPMGHSQKYRLLPASYHYLTNLLKEVLPMKKEELFESTVWQKQNYDAAFRQMIEEINSQKAKTHKKESENIALWVKIDELRTIINIHNNKIREQNDTIGLQKKLIVKKEMQIKELERSYFYKIGKALSSYLILIAVIIILAVMVFYNRRLYTATLRQKKIQEEQKNRLHKQHLELQDQNEELKEHKRLLTEQRETLQEQNIKLKEQQAQIHDQQVALADANKKAFIANLVIGLNHDLATPISNISLSGEAIAASAQRLNNPGAGDPEKNRLQLSDIILKAGNIIKEETQKIKDWIKGFKQISTDQLKEELRNIDLKDYIETFAQSILFRLEKNNVSFSVSTTETICINTYPGFISQALQNLTDNSLEHGFSAEKNKSDKIIAVKISKINSDIRIEYSDNGKGIPPELINNIFDPYFSTSNQINKGLGLFNVKHIVENGLKGTLLCESKTGQGTTFVLNLPFNYT